MSEFSTWRIGPRADTHRHSAAAHTRTTQNARIHELGTEADDIVVICTQHGRIDAAGTADGLVARGRCVIPHGSIPAAVRVEANAAGLVGVLQRAEARGGRLAVADLGADVGAPGRGSVAGGAVAASRCSALPGGGIDELFEAGLLGRFDMAATPCAACRKSASVDYRIGKIGGMNFGDRQRGQGRNFSVPKDVSGDYNRGLSGKFNLHVGVGAAVRAPIMDANLYVRHVS